MSAHTPGPWAEEWNMHRVNRCADPVRQARIVAGANNMTVVAVPFGNGVENREANASLIAAAPELLAFAQWALNDLEIFERSLPPKGATKERQRLHGILRSRLADGRAAIAKAKGGGK